MGVPTGVLNRFLFLGFVQRPDQAGEAGVGVVVGTLQCQELGDIGGRDVDLLQQRIDVVEEAVGVDGR